jgi:hypothetical protein
MHFSLSIDKNNIESSCARIARELLNNWSLVAGENSYRMAEIEIYVRYSAQHAGDMVESKTLTVQAGNWDLHGAGVELPYGNAACQGGILIRAMQSLSEPGKYVYGPMRCFTELAGNTGFVCQNEVSLRLEKDTHTVIPFEEPVAVQGAADPAGLPDQAYTEKRYRYLLLPVLVHAGKKMAAVLKNPEQ